MQGADARKGMGCMHPHLRCARTHQRPANHFKLLSLSGFAGWLGCLGWKFERHIEVFGQQTENG